MDTWYNVTDPKFNLHLHVDAVAALWHLVKPSTDGDINSIELFDNGGEIMGAAICRTQTRRTELFEWREILRDIS
jgi:putative hemin transport protein